MRTISMPENACPWCGHMFDACGSLGLSSPSKGDVSVCVNCAGLLVFGEKLELLIVDAAAEFELRLKDPAAYAEMAVLRNVIREANQMEG